jgi:hypothetical protein
MSTLLEPAAVERARKALEEHAWDEAYEAFVSADRAQPLAAEDLELLADAAWWSAHPKEKVDALERAYALYSAGGDRRRAALVAVKLANHCADIGRPPSRPGGSVGPSACSMASRRASSTDTSTAPAPSRCGSEAIRGTCSSSGPRRSTSACG